MQSLNMLLDFLTHNRKLHICITDISGILNHDLLNISAEYRVHSKPFCNVAKKTQKGFALCMRSKSICNRRSIKNKESFAGLCPFGLFEIVYPVKITSEVVCIIYIGNIVTNRQLSCQRLKKSCAFTKGDLEFLSSLLENAESAVSVEHCFAMAEIIADYIRLIYNTHPPVCLSYHWSVKFAIQYMELNFYRPVSLKEVANTCFVNEKYLGRLFKTETGVTFHEYLTNIRLNYASSLLKFSDKTILSIALDSGFSSPSYFDFIFKEKYGKTPKSYRHAYRYVRKNI